MREIRTSGSMRGCRKRAAMCRACTLLYSVPLKMIAAKKPKHWVGARQSGKAWVENKSSCLPIALPVCWINDLFA